MYFIKKLYFIGNFEFKLLLIEYFNSRVNIDSFIKTFDWNLQKIKSLKLDSLGFYKNCKNCLIENDFRSPKNSRLIKYYICNWIWMILFKAIFINYFYNFRDY